VLFFGDRPRVAPYELRHSLPCHEHVYEARTTFEWQIAYSQTNQAEYPVLLEMLLSPQIDRHPSDISVMGNFLLLHGTFSNLYPNSHFSKFNLPFICIWFTDYRNSCPHLDIPTIRTCSGRLPWPRNLVSRPKAQRNYLRPLQMARRLGRQ